MKFGNFLNRFNSLYNGNATKFHTKKLRRRNNQEGNVAIHGLQTIILKKFVGFHDESKCWKRVKGNNIIQKVGIWNSIVICKDQENLLTNGGRDFIHTQVWTNTSAGARGAGYIALSEDTGAANASHTTLASEITTNGLARADAGTKTHTNGTNTSTIQHTFTVVTAAFTAVQISALLNASSAGTMVNEKVFTPTALDVGDQIQVTWTITAG